MSDETSITVAAICDRVGRKAIAAALNVRATAVSNAVKDDCFPSKWYLVVKSLADGAGIDCPDRLFAFSRPERGEQECPNISQTEQKGAA